MSYLYGKVVNVVLSEMCVNKTVILIILFVI